MSPLGKICPQCGASYLGAKCPLHPKSVERDKRKRDRPAWSQVYNTQAWRRLRKKVLARDGYECYWCGKPATHLGHWKPFVEDGVVNIRLAFDPANVQAECESCNGREANARQRRRRGA